jgi:hypothetical protein
METRFSALVVMLYHVESNVVVLSSKVGNEFMMVQQRSVVDAGMHLFEFNYVGILTHRVIDDGHFGSKR